MFRFILISLLLCLPQQLLGSDFSLHQQQGRQAGPTLLVVAGIQGDEPGGFNAAALLATRYQVERGNLWVVPNLNFPSIIKRTRGLHGDMNRKFLHLSPRDPEFPAVNRIKKIISDPSVDVVLNLHDGSGFYSPQYIDKLRNPQRWGQSCIIDQVALPGARFGQLEQLSQAVIAQINQQTIDPEHLFHLKNTDTADSDPEMQQSLTYYALNQNKPAFGIETSKSFPTHLRAFYHLAALEGYMQQLGIRFSRDFQLTPQGVKRALKEDILVSFGDGRIRLELHNLRQTLKYFPLPKGDLQFESNNPLVAVIPYRNRYRIHYGNNRLSFLKPQFFDYDQSLDEVEMLIDDNLVRVPFGSRIAVNNSFQVLSPKGYRVNVIGFRKAGQRDENRLPIIRRQLSPEHSIDKDGKIFRVEVYHDKRFSGMVLVDFGKHAKQQLVSLSERTVN
ncbi:Carboxypeptidase controlling helical cell shape [Malonomonas rubra DSM 5091]|uniref:Carboxypeptidase controlling helical cell shape n=1 Tax=Malonomonas rubra DSM 5091 TaxID=1122189 RepID=A0A1M6GGI9_MALRU|nr:M14 family metallopeptidase [Malonomonas rubra]SHJ09065.1 Carboxypeptidase controlling helical cell shape [Malonomonas rubra DSM 5091]